MSSSMSAAAPSSGATSHMGAQSGMHVHVPSIGIYGRDADTNAVVKQAGLRLGQGETKLELIGHNTPDGVFTTAGFDTHVPNLRKLRSDSRQKPQPGFVESWITLPHGKLRARDLVSWDSDVNQPAEVAFMGTDFRGFVANEAVLDVGDDETDYEDNDPFKYLSITSTTDGIPNRLWAMTKGANYVQETDPNTVEILITNFAPQRRRGVFWSLHYQAAFDAVGFARNPDYQSVIQYEKFVEAAKRFDEHEWNDDVMEMNIGQPFPYVIPESIQSLPGVRPAALAILTGPPDDPGVRTANDGVLVTNDPWSRPICPLAQDDGLLVT